MAYIRLVDTLCKLYYGYRTKLRGPLGFRTGTRHIRGMPPGKPRWRISQFLLRLDVTKITHRLREMR